MGKSASEYVARISERAYAIWEHEGRPEGGAERHWRAHMEAAGQRLLREDLQSRSVVDLFS